MKTPVLFVTILFLAAGLAAQTSASGESPQPGTPPAQQNQGMRERPGHQHMMAMQHHMEEMKAQIAKMQASVDEMKANAAKIKDPAARRQAELDAQMWQGMVDHMHGMQKMMAEHGGMMGPGPGMHHHMHHPGPGGTPPPPPSPQPQ